VPYVFGSSDGLFNLGSAVSFAQVLPTGVYIAMNGRCFTWDRVRKNQRTGIFESTESTCRGSGIGSKPVLVRRSSRCGACRAARGEASC
jgi:L-asparaginase/Glu-tRNA(Gln) amidotransferase subunit D